MPRSLAVRLLIVRLQKYLGVNKVVIASFAEYHGKRNPVERVHAAEEKELQKHRTFHVVEKEPDSEEHMATMENFASDVGGVLSQASFGGKHIQVIRSIGPKENFILKDE